MEYNRNFFIAIGLSLLIILAWQYFYVAPKNADQQKAQEIAHQIEKDENAQNQAVPTAENGTVTPPQNKDETNPAGFEMTPDARDAALKKSKRVAIDTPELQGSINLVGAQFDDLFLKNYRLTVDKNSPEIALLNPNGFNTTYIAEFGFTGKGLPAGSLPQFNTEWKVDGENTTLTPKTPVHLVYDNGQGQVFHRVISVDENYMFTISDSVTNNASSVVSLLPYARVARAAPPEHASATYLLHEGMIGVAGDDGLKEEKYSALKDLKPDAANEKKMVFDKVKGGFIGITDKYWAVAAIPPQDEEYTSRFVYFDRLSTHYQSDLTGKAITVASGTTETVTNHLFAGAKRVETINAYQDNLKILKFELLIDWGWFSIITKPMFALIDILYKLTNNFGVAILLVTVILKAVLFPLANKSYKSMARMKVVQPAMMEIRTKYADDKVKQQQAIMELYRTEKINPLAGCWPLLVQFPIFFALYKVLYITIEMRHAPFFGWIQDLAAPDPTSLFNLFGWLPYNVPAFLMIGAWPVIMGITMFLQMRMNPTPPDPTQAMIFTWMPIVFTFMLASFPAGLVIYWAWNNTLSICQQAIIMKSQGAKIELWDNLKAIFKKKPKKETK